MSHQSMHGPQAQHLLSSNPSLQLHKHLQHNDYPSLKYCPGDSRRKPFLSEEEEEEGVADEYNSGGTDRGNNDYYDASLLSRIYLSGWGVEGGVAFSFCYISVSMFFFIFFIHYHSFLDCLVK